MAVIEKQTAKQFVAEMPQSRTEVCLGVRGVADGLADRECCLEVSARQLRQRTKPLSSDSADAGLRRQYVAVGMDQLADVAEGLQQVRGDFSCRR